MELIEISTKMGYLQLMCPTYPDSYTQGFSIKMMLRSYKENNFAHLKQYSFQLIWE